MDEKAVGKMQENVCEMLAIMAKYVSGDYTLNQIRILQYINLCSRYRGASTSHADICAMLNLPSATVSRAVAKFTEKNIVREEVDPGDGRRRRVTGTGKLAVTVPSKLDIELAEFAERGGFLRAGPRKPAE